MYWKVSAFLSLICAACIAVMAFNETPGNTTAEIIQADEAVASLARSYATWRAKNPSKDMFDVFDAEVMLWREFTRKSPSLDWWNNRTMTARGLCELSTNPGVGEYEWNDRKSQAKESFRILELPIRTLLAIGWGILFGLGFFVALALVRFVWYFLLARLTELSRAVQGKQT